MDRRIWTAVVLLLACVVMLSCLGEERMTPSPQPASVASPTPETVPPSAPPPTLTPVPTLTPTTAPLTESPAPPVETPYYEDRSGPTNLLASYYNAINRQEYSRAWAYWESPPSPSYEDFVQGFADTVSVLLTVSPPTWFEGAAGSAYTSIPALLSATHVDGSRHNFVACFVTRRPNVGGPEVEREWSLFDATVHPAPDNSAAATLLTEACGATLETEYDDRSGAVRLLASYYNAINQGDYRRAWAYWETPPHPSFDEFAAGFADTEFVLVVVQPPTWFEGAVGSVYTSIPALLSATHADGSRHNFQGCFVARRPNVGEPGGEQEWSLFDATIRPSPANTTDVTVIEQVCAVR